MLNYKQPYGYEAREFARNLVCAGAPVLCCAWTTSKGKEKDSEKEGKEKRKEKGQRKNTKESLTYLIVSNGFAELNAKEKTQLSPTEYEKLSKALEKAKKSGLGKFADGGATADVDKKLADSKKKGGKQQVPHVRKLVFAKKPEERSKILNKYLNKEIPAIVDHVRSGSTLSVELIPDEKNNIHEITMMKKKKGGNRKSERYANEAKEFTEQRLLSQRVTVKILAADQKFNLYGVVSHPNGQIAVSLLRTGLAEYESWTAELLSKEEQKAMKEALKSAQEKRLHIWQYKHAEHLSHDYVPVTVTQIISGDSFFAKFEDGTEERFTLSSIYQPRYKEERQKSKKAEGGKKKEAKEGKETKETKETKEAPAQYTEHPWARPAREFLREKLIGKKAMLLYEYKRVWKNQSDESDSKTQKNESKKKSEPRIQKFASVLVDKELSFFFCFSLNIAVSLVTAGLAEVVSYGDKSAAYAELQKAQEKAKKAKKGIHGNSEPKPIVDYSKSLEDVPPNVIIGLQNYLQGHKRKAVVEFVISGTRLKIYLPEQNCFIPLMLAYVICDPLPKRGKGQIKGQSTFGSTALKYVNQQIWQRNVCKVWVNGKDLGLDLLEKGLAKIARPPLSFNVRGKRQAPASDVPNAYLEAEAAASEKQIGRWKEIFAKKQEYEEKKKQNDMTGKEAAVVVSHIDSGVYFWINKSGNDLEKLEEAMSRLRSQRLSSSLRVGRTVSTSYDGLNCRARLIRQLQDRSWLVIFIDYGNKAIVAEKDLIGLSPDVTLDKFRPLAQLCQLAALRSPHRKSEYFNAAGEHFAKLVMPDKESKTLKELKVKVLHDDGRKWHVVLLDQNTIVNEQMLKEGYARFDQKGKEAPQQLLTSKDEFAQNYLKTAKKLNDDALEGRRGLWEFEVVSYFFHLSFLKETELIAIKKFCFFFETLFQIKQLAKFKKLLIVTILE
ncbi:tudor domain-containing protein / nuclease family protein [Reticulomyxa filosa]|uniref:Tudor domain-containing protein / nuclease family protein n=1 Tax=Reticulomyxa filosa TaxID=46433 RepID=X6NTT0_RETFI|nr:tudor domain-containing protein / nuclease family protein [Reticulomyxa filosa]|eukprot:ETO29361.1 tudor domain-containing protein / nuclease family protein [Reticulomyxa filosa]